MAGREFVMKGDDDMTGSGGGAAAAEGSRKGRSRREGAEGISLLREASQNY